MAHDCPKPRYSEQIEIGVLYFVAQEKRMVKEKDQNVWIDHDILQLTMKLKTT